MPGADFKRLRLFYCKKTVLSPTISIKPNYSLLITIDTD